MSRFLEAIRLTLSVFSPRVIKSVQIDLLRMFWQMRADRKWQIFDERIRHRRHS